ncbi:MAG: TIGR04086 family membrane protein [Oscillospiraceae bacterium]|nr:TIGR04086 family membrane protein [Oscillospiraceae bacterium]MDE6004567.1 TIGR04086 family membrane protein [Oscillospiraceae bacterium]MDE6658093.1 TIGR04086 family membrane protein [Oscillospiraceae bacterium]
MKKMVIQLRHASIWQSKIGKYLFPTLEGLVWLSGGSLLCAGLLLIGTIPAIAMTYLMHILWSISAFCSGRRAGFHGRTHGIRTGFICSVILCVILFLGCFALQENITERLLTRCLFMLITGIIGGIIGVNTKLKKPPY